MSDVAAALPPEPFDLLAATWPPEETARLGDWRLCRADGAGQRVCSAWPLSRDWRGLADTVPGIEAWYRARGLAPMLQLPDGLGDDAALIAQGYAVVGETAIVRLDATALAERPLRGTGSPYLIQVRAPLAALDELWAKGGVGGPRRAVIARAEPIGRIIALRLEHRLAGVVFVARLRKAACVHALHVAPWGRRRGAGHDLMVAAARWAVEAGAESLVFSVERANAPALALYQGLGAVEIGGYRYLLGSA
ncbi:MAG: GNAT family N-acetyltransferase [Pseudomonadota bacterium]